MPSLASHASIALFRLLKLQKGLSSAEALNARIVKMRAANLPYGPQASVAKRFDVAERLHDGFPVITMSPKNAQPTRHVLYLHGGAYIAEITKYHWQYLGWLIDRTGVSVTIPIYPLAPEHTVEAVLKFARSVYDHTVGQWGTTNLDIMGDSAGGGLALALCQQLAAEGKPISRSLILFAPWVDVGLTNPEVETYAPRDPWLAAPGLIEAGRLYAGDRATDHPTVSPINATMTGLPPTHIFAGTRDILFPDCRRLEAALRDAGVPTTFHEYPGMFHVWLVFSMPEARKALGEIATLMEL